MQKYTSKKFWRELIPKSQVQNYPLLFIHGIFPKISDWHKTIKTITDNFYEISANDKNEITTSFIEMHDGKGIWNVSYYTKPLIADSVMGDLSKYARRLRTIIKFIKTVTNSKKVIIAAHSMGGLVARKYMTLSNVCFDSVYKILTIATPNEGVRVSPKISGTLGDLNPKSDFIIGLRRIWGIYTKKSKIKNWGVIGAIDNKSIINKLAKDDQKTDSAGPGFVRISSSIPFNEWKELFEENKYNKKIINSKHFAFKMLVNANHEDVLFHKGTFEGIEWLIT